MTACGWLGRWPLGLLLAVFWAASVSCAHAETRVALVVGNSAYRHTMALTNPLHDASDLAAALQRTGFDVIVALDAGKAQMDGALRAFADKLAKADVALFFYAGHGLQVGQQNYLVPVDAQLQRERDLEFEAVKLDFVLRQMEIDREGKTTIVMLDACRDNPLARNLARSMGTRSTAIGQGLAPASTGVGTFIAYSTQPGNVALDGAGRNSPFTGALVQNVATRGRNLNATMIEVRKEVIRTTGGRQVPWDHSALTGDFYFVPGEIVAPGSTTAAPAAKSDDVEALKARIATLEAAQKSQASAPRLPGLDLAKVTELRTKIVMAEEKAKELQARLLEARRSEGQAKDLTERQQLLQGSMRIQSDMTQASLTAKRLKEELAKLEVPPPPANPPAASGSGIDIAPTRSERGYGIYENAMLAGEKIKFGAADSVAGCLNTCRNTPGCMAGEYVSGASPQSACSVYRHVQRLQAGVPGTTAFVKTASGAVAGIPPVQPKANADASAANFELAENVRIDGIALGAVSRAPSPAACRETCDKTSGCVAFQHGRRIPVMGQCQLFASVVARHEDQAWRSGVRKTSADTPATERSSRAPQPKRDSDLVGRTENGFEIFEDAMIVGELIKKSAANNPDACRIVCHNTAGCVAAHYNAHLADQQTHCAVYGVLSAIKARMWAGTALVRK